MRVETRLTGKVMNACAGQRGKAITAAILAAENESAAALKARAVQLSSGTFSTQQQKQAARVLNGGKGLYSKRSPVALAPYVVNAQSGFFMRHWQARLAWTGDGTRITLFNTAPYSKYLLAGTSRMIARPVSLKAAELEQPARLRRLQAAFRGVMK